RADLDLVHPEDELADRVDDLRGVDRDGRHGPDRDPAGRDEVRAPDEHGEHGHEEGRVDEREEDRKSTRLNSSHVKISYAVFCLNCTAAHAIYSLPLHAALPISSRPGSRPSRR